MARTQTTEADDYNKAGDEAAARGERNAAEVLYDFAAEEQTDADRAATGARPRRGTQQG